ncbi:MAG TPA: molybdenum cofactor guanylyltransferase [Acidimicrobiales bacterium]|nr:molybdenum cofactor guanylyltransferase [Acidimicrobiales bacterium]
MGRLAFDGVVLTGGASRRMGRDKALVEVGGRALAVGVARVLRDAGADKVFAVGGAIDALADLGLHAVPDEFPGEGPLGGLLTALSHASSPLVAVLACDLPAAAPSAVRLVVAALDADPDLACAIPMVQGHSQPLHGAWRRSSRPEIQAMFDRGERAMHRAIAGLAGIAVHGVDPAAVADVDTPADMRGRRALTPTPPGAAL